MAVLNANRGNGDKIHIRTHVVGSQIIQEKNEGNEREVETRKRVQTEQSKAEGKTHTHTHFKERTVFFLDSVFEAEIGGGRTGERKW